MIVALNGRSHLGGLGNLLLHEEAISIYTELNLYMEIAFFTLTQILNRGSFEILTKSFFIPIQIVPWVYSILR